MAEIWKRMTVKRSGLVKLLTQFIRSPVVGYKFMDNTITSYV